MSQRKRAGWAQAAADGLSALSESRHPLMVPEIMNEVKFQEYFSPKIILCRLSLK